MSIVKCGKQNPIINLAGKMPKLKIIYNSFELINIIKTQNVNKNKIFLN